ncbi:hypothetical protein ACOI9X_06425 [Pseudomonas sp. P2757]|uniref:hypothetical protein n=1 Tax=unclassified Pseudomonas TaxID=196821 RepID=UPI003B5B2664
MSKSQVELELIDALSCCKRSIIAEAGKAWANCNFSLAEPKLVKSFAMESGKGVHYLNSSLATNFNSSQNRFVLKFAAVYTHQRPYVERRPRNISLRKGSNRTERCELADLGFLSVFVDQNKKVITSRASFFQAKKDESIDNETQQWLYDFDGGFEYKHSSFWELTDCATPSREFPAWSEGRSSAFQYLLLLSNTKIKVRLSPWSMDHTHSFGFFFYRLLTMGAGIPYQSNESMSGGWSSIVSDVLRMGGGDMAGKHRGSIGLDKIVDYFNSFKSHDRYFYESAGAEGFPIIIAIMQDAQFKDEG